VCGAWGNKRWNIWYSFFEWIRTGMILPRNVVSLLDYFSSSSFVKKYQKVLMLIWHATIWKVWEARNAVTFSSKNFKAEEIVEAIKVISWRWFIDRKIRGPCFYYEWYANPLLCLISWSMAIVSLRDEHPLVLFPNCGLVLFVLFSFSNKFWSSRKRRSSPYILRSFIRFGILCYINFMLYEWNPRP